MSDRSSYSLDPKQIEDTIVILYSEREALLAFDRVLRKIIFHEISLVFIFCASHSAKLIARFYSLEAFQFLSSWFPLLFVLLASFLLIQEVRAIRHLRDIQSSLEIKRFSWFYEFQKIRIPHLLLILFLLLAIILPIISKGQSQPLDIISALSFLSLAVTYGLYRFKTLRPVKESLDNNERLRISFLEKQRALKENDKAMTVFIKEAEYRHIARVEKALISIDRKRTIEQNRKKPNQSAHAVQQSVTVLRKKSVLEAPIQLRIQLRIDELSTDPKPSDAKEDVNDNWLVPVPETSWEISYTIIENPQFIIIRDLIEKTRPKQQSSEMKVSA